MSGYKIVNLHLQLEVLPIELHPLPSPTLFNPSPPPFHLDWQILAKTYFFTKYCRVQSRYRHVLVRHYVGRGIVCWIQRWRSLLVTTDTSATTIKGHAATAIIRLVDTPTRRPPATANAGLATTAKKAEPERQGHQSQQREGQQQQQRHSRQPQQRQGLQKQQQPRNNGVRNSATAAMTGSCNLIDIASKITRTQPVTTATTGPATKEMTRPATTTAGPATKEMTRPATTTAGSATKEMTRPATTTKAGPATREMTRPATTTKAGPAMLQQQERQNLQQQQRKSLQQQCLAYHHNVQSLGQR